ncbi:MAG: cytochrome [Hydrocarboniphaga sp.]|uniref:cytochrome P450 n=1 Tax=Hydrocarboniphaga sp. TaxID=2033016 RepID=UPI00260F2F54|nr:cytochrome P450 [Hydrocarboniphaga sp.]MDB5967870.1 cytochrome [Hydrocarboniphaga sp.]
MTITASQIMKPIDDVTDLEAAVHPVLEICRVANGRAMLKGQGTRFEALVLPNFFGHHDDVPSFAALSFDAARQVLIDTENFSSDLYRETLERAVGRGLFGMDPPEHSRYRALLQMGFNPRIVAAWDAEIIRPVIERTIVAVKHQGRADLAHEVTLLFPYEIICRILGFPTEDVQYVSDRITKMTRATYDFDAAMKASAEMNVYVDKYIAERRKIARDDFISVLMVAEVDGVRLSDENLKAFIFHLFPAGMETTFRGASNLTHLLLSHPEQLERLRTNPALIGPSIEETLRFEGPASMFPRRAKHDTSVGGISVPAGSMVYVMMAAANRDPSRWDRPHEFDISRESKAHLGFGYGAHACIGLHLARKELQIYMEQVLEHLPGVRWDPATNGTPPPILGWTLRSALSLPVVWDAP